MINDRLTGKKDSEYNDYARARNQAKWACKKTKREFEKDIAMSAKTVPKKFWKYVNSKLKYKENISKLRTAQGIAETDYEKAEELSKFFKSVFTQENKSNLPNIMQKIDETIGDIDFSMEDVSKLLKSVNINKAIGPDKVHPLILNELSAELAQPLYILFRKSLDEGVLPAEWKIANISPIFKNKGSKQDATNYRPVSLTSVVSKLMEKLIRKGIIEHMATHSLLTKDQHGFVDGRSCITNLLVTLDQWTKIIEDNGCIDCIYLDFMKAFDSVPHERLLLKIKSYGVHGKLIKW